MCNYFFFIIYVFFCIVALCGTMWHYVALFLYKAKIEIHCLFDKFCFFLHCGTVWHYVALCGTMCNSKKLKKTRVLWYFRVLFLHCGTMWHYVALCGTMWHYSCIKQKLKYVVFLMNFVFFFLHCGTMWHYVALFLYKAKIELHCVFDKFCFFALWHYVALCGTIPV